MKNFGRVVRLALRYRFTLAVSLLCALGVGLLWGANIGTIYPFVEIAFQGDSLQQWVDSEIDKSRKTSAELTDELKQLRRKLADKPKKGPGLICAKHPPGRSGKLNLVPFSADNKRDDHNTIRAKIGLAESRVAAEQKAISRYQWLKPYVDRYLPRDPFQTLAVLVGFLLLGTVAKDLLLIAHYILIARLSQLSTFELRKQFYRRTLSLELARFGNEGTSDLMSRFTHDMVYVANGTDILFGKVVREPLKMAACLIGAGWICWRLLFLSLVLAPATALLIRWLAKTLKRANRRAMEEMAQLYNSLDETFRGIKVVKAFTMERQERWRFHINSKKFYKAAMRIARYNSLSRPINEVAGILTISLALLAGAYLAMGGETHLFGFRMSQRPLNLGALFLFYGLLAGAADPLRKLSDVFLSLQRAAAASARIYTMLDRQSKICDPQHPRPLGRHNRDLVFDNVHFAYRADQPVLKTINLSIPFGQTVALVGPNGCGKSSLANLIPRFSDPTAGEIRLDGVPLTQVRVRDLRSQIGLVTQETLLFDDTVFNNIRYGSPQATTQQVIQAAKQAHAHRFVENELAEGYRTVVGTGGCRLSGGQRQRIALARAILRDPAILILDEATSQIDLESEQLIQKVLEEFTRNRTTLIITHRMSILSLADQIVVMGQSEGILDVGTHEELLARCDLYQRLHQLQFNDLRQSA